MDNELVKIVYEKLCYITKELNVEDISDEELRRLSVALRLLLIDNRLYEVASSFNVNKLRVLVPEEKQSSFSDPNLKLYQEGGGKHKGTRIKRLMIYNKLLTPEEIKAEYETVKKQKNKPVELRTFMQNPTLIIHQVEINKEEVIKYVCNKLGGAHYDKRRATPIARDGKFSLEGKYALLDKINLEIAEKKEIYFELLSIGQKIAKSRDIQKLKRKLKERLDKIKITKRF